MQNMMIKSIFNHTNAHKPYTSSYSMAENEGFTVIKPNLSLKQKIKGQILGFND